MAAKTTPRKLVTEIVKGDMIRVSEWNGTAWAERFVAADRVGTKTSEGLKSQRVQYFVYAADGEELFTGLANSKVRVQG